MGDEEGFRDNPRARDLDRLSVAEYLDRLGLRGGWLRALLDAAFAAEYGLDNGELSALNLLILLSIVNVATVYMPLLIFVNGRVSIGHIVVGYAGILLLGAASIAIGVFASALARTQVVAVIVGAVTTAVLAAVTDWPEPTRAIVTATG